MLFYLFITMLCECFLSHFILNLFHRHLRQLIRADRIFNSRRISVHAELVQDLGELTTDGQRENPLGHRGFLLLQFFDAVQMLLELIGRFQL